MKALIAVSVVGALFAATALAQPAGTWRDQWFKAKYGRTFTEQTVTPAVRTAEPESPADSHREQWLKAKYGRYSGQEEARQAAEQGSAFRADTAARAESPIYSHREQWLKAKYGRYSPQVEASLNRGN